MKSLFVHGCEILTTGLGNDPGEGREGSDKMGYVVPSQEETNGKKSLPAGYSARTSKMRERAAPVC